ncbi:MAG: preprotein translocase subunit SecG [Patescibacteria group bacterium]
MNLRLIINILQIVVSFVFIVSILLQARGSGLGAAWGGDSMIFRTKRGIEKTLHYISIVLAVIFLGLSLALIFI